MAHERTPLDYMNGCCHVFALAAQALTGWPMQAVMVSGVKVGEEPLLGNNDIVHVFLIDPEGYRFDAYGRGTSRGEYEIEKENELGEPVVTVDCDAALIERMVRMGWLSPFAPSEVESAKHLVNEVHADEYNTPCPAP
jgi:hypothetical protein